MRVVAKVKLTWRKGEIILIGDRGKCKMVIQDRGKGKIII